MQEGRKNLEGKLPAEPVSPRRGLQPIQQQAQLFRS
jgi:hypothetical protein